MKIGSLALPLMLVLALLLCPAALAVTPQITVSASAVTLLGGNQTISITLTLIDSSSSGMMKIAGTNIIPPGSVSTVTPGSTAVVGPIWGSDVIVNAYGVSNLTYYRTQVFTVSNGVIGSTPVLSNFYQFQGSGTVDLSTATPLAPSFFTGPNGNVSMPGSLTVAGQIISTVSTGTAPLSVTSATQVPNLNASQLGGLNPPGSAIDGISDANALTNHTFDISLNTLKSSTNTAGHVPRNNGTKYVDGQLGFSDLSGTASTSQIGTGTPAAGTYVDGGTGAWTALPSSNSVLFVVGNGGFLTINTGAASPTCASGTAGANCQLQTFATSRTLIRIDVLVTVAASGCSTNAVVGVKDLTSATVLSSLTLTTSGYKDSGALSVATTAGDIIGVGLLTAPSGCTGFPSFNTLSATFQ